MRAVDLEIGFRNQGEWTGLGSFSGPVSKAALDLWARDCEAAAGTYELRENGSAVARYLFLVGPAGSVETVEVLDLD